MSNLCMLGQCERILDVHAQVSNRVLDLGMSKQDLQSTRTRERAGGSDIPFLPMMLRPLIVRSARLSGLSSSPGSTANLRVRRLPPVEPRELAGLSKGRGIPAGHPSDGVFEISAGRAWSSPADIGGQFVRRPIWKCPFQKVQERRHSRAEQPPRWVERPQSDLGPVDIPPIYQCAVSQVVAHQ